VALQGTIYVNTSLIGYWSAQRVAGQPGEVCTYECEVGTLGASFNAERSHKFRLDHHYDNGAMSLASCVLSTAADLFEGSNED